MVKTTTMAVFAAASMATSLSAGSLAEPVAAPTPAPVAVAPAPIRRGGEWTGFYGGAQLGYGQVETPAFTDDADDLLYGLHAGYNYDLGNFVVGAEVDYDWTQISDSGSGIDLDNVARFKVRAGYDAGDLLPYVTLGAAKAFTGGALDADDDGTFYGVGMDYQFAPNLRVGGELLTHDFDDFAGSGADIEATTIAARVSYNF